MAELTTSFFNLRMPDGQAKQESQAERAMRGHIDERLMYRRT